MTHILNSSHTEKLGVAQVAMVCAKARMIFRSVSVDDVGIDGFIELVEDGVATGIIVGVQIKSGESFTDGEGQQFKLVADQAHFGYWARCSFPVIGVIYSPKHEKAVWLNLTELSTDERIVSGPYTVTVSLTNETEFTPANLISQVVFVAQKYTFQRKTLWQIQKLIEPKSQKATLSIPSIEISDDKSEAWKELIAIFFSEKSAIDEIADTGYRLSWYFPSVSDELKNYFIASLNELNDFQLVRIIESIHILLEENAESAAELIVDLLRYKPDVCDQIKNLLKKKQIPTTLREAAIQVVEVINDGFDEELRKDIGAL